jgi:inosose dehydratase
MQLDKVPIMDRRTFLMAAAAATGSAALMADESSGPALHLATNVYPWKTFYQRDGRDSRQELPALIAEVKAAGLDGFEPAVESPEELDVLLPLLEQHHLELRSLYVNSVLHDADRASASRESVLAIARKAAGHGLKIVVTNPSPVRWGGPEDKSDSQLVTQARSLDALGADLRALGLTLAYHNHDAELRQGAREFHHMLTATSPENVAFCLDAHWVYRGCGDSQVALDDVVRRYGDRIVELHLRQSDHGVWTEVFGPGDIDYRALTRQLAERGLKPHVVLEQAVEAKTPKTLSAEKAHTQSAVAARAIFQPLARG